MTEKDDFQIMAVEPSEDLVFTIASTFKYDEGMIRTFLSYNVMTPNQVGVMTENTAHNIHRYARKRLLRGEVVTDLDSVQPFPEINTKGPKFIINNEKFENFVYRMAKRKQRDLELTKLKRLRKRKQ